MNRGMQYIALGCAAWTLLFQCCSASDKVVADVAKLSATTDVEVAADVQQMSDLAESVDTDAGITVEAGTELAPADQYYPPDCGDGICNFMGDENCENCPQDCTCTVCGNGVCEPGWPAENWEICPLDCGPCGDGICGKHESDPDFFCTKDCGQACGDAVCGGLESALLGQGQYCPVDCGICQDGVCSFQELFDPGFADCMSEDCKAGCGDGECSGGESYKSCPVDCGACGDGICGKFLDQQENCPLDCVQPCGDGKCAGGESPEICPVDCGLCGDGICSLLEYSLAACPQDCPENCGDGICQPELDESKKVCPVDCACVPTCNPDWECGEDDNGCGQSCGGCPQGALCIEHHCCVPACKGAQCGDDGCGNSCGECSKAALCVDQQCVCQGDCTGKVCGDDGCGQSCGDCQPDAFDCTQDCVAGQCLYQVQQDFCLMPLVGDNPVLNKCLPAGLPYSFDSCMACEPYQSQTEWSAVANGTKCGETGQLCWYGKCCDPAQACADAECGIACGVSCGECAEGLVCVSGKCQDPDCVPDCGGKQCGDDGCSGTCGDCDDSAFCTQDSCVAGLCQHVAQTAGWCAVAQDLGGSVLTYCVPDGSVDPTSPCLVCDSQADSADWSTLPDGQACAFDLGVCQTGVCCLATLNCAGAECGDDGCGSTCGTCNPGETCVAGKCLCTPDCTGKECGGDGCGATCGSCMPPEVCTNGQCGCTPDCDGLECGSDGCGGTCGTCPMPEICFLGECICVPDCAAKMCGDDGCGSSCGDCVAPEICTGGQCGCTADCAGKQCGPDGCYGSCGQCDSGVLCQEGACGASCTDPGQGTWDGCVNGETTEFLVNTHTYKMQTEPDVAVLPDGGFVVVWRSNEQDGSLASIFGQVFGPDGKPVGSEIPVNQNIQDMQDLPSVTGLADGTFVVAWTGYMEEMLGYVVLARRFGPSGAPLSDDVALAPEKSSFQDAVDLQAGFDQSFQAAWQRSGPPDFETQIWSGAYLAGLGGGASPVQLDAGDTSDNRFPSLALFPCGNAVAVFQTCPTMPTDPPLDGDDCGVLMQAFSPAGQLLGAGGQVNEFFTGDQQKPSTAVVGEDQAVVVWQSYGQGGQANNIFARPVDVQGAPTGGEFQVTEFSNEFRWEEDPQIAGAMDGSYVVAWSENNDFFKQYEVKLARFDTGGNLVAPYLRVNTFDEGYQWLPAVAMTEGGAFVVVWESRNHSGQPEEEGQDGYSGGIFALRFNADGTLCPVGDCVFKGTACPAGCDDHNPCTADWCHPQTGCRYTDRTDGTDCGQCGFECIAGICASALCLGKECGNDGCGGSCGTCAVAQTCVQGMCQDFTSECNDDNAVDWDGCTQWKTTEFVVNEETGSDQTDPFLLPLDDGAFLVSWASMGQDGFDEGVFARRFNAAGEPLGPEEQVNLWAVNPQKHARAARLSNGGWAFAWETTFGFATSYDVVARAYDAQGQSPETSVLVNMWQDDMQWHPAVGGFAAGGFVVVWESRNQWPDQSATGIFFQRFEADASHIGGETPVNSYTIGFQSDPVVTVLENDSFFIAWESDTADPDGSTGIYGRVFDADGENPGAEVPLNCLFVDGEQLNPSVDARADGTSFVATWETWDTGGTESDVVAAVFGSLGQPISDNEFVVSNSADGNQVHPVVASLPDGRFVVAWTSCFPDDATCSVKARRFQADGQPVGADIMVNVFDSGKQGMVEESGGLHAAAFDDGSFGIVWSSLDQAGEGWDIFMQRFNWAGERLYR